MLRPAGLGEAGEARNEERVEGQVAMGVPWRGAPGSKDHRGADSGTGGRLWKQRVVWAVSSSVRGGHGGLGWGL